jgi:2-phospho-L-lactate guanylyltransferase
MSLWMVIPVRSFRDGKRRLAPVLDAGERTALVQWLLTHTLDQAAEFPGWSQTLVVTACREVSAWVNNLGIRVLEESGTGGLNGALRQAQATVVALGGSRMLVVSSDLPLLEPRHLRHLAGVASDDVLVLAPDRTDHGTNAMCLPVSRAFDFAFGPDSFSRHCERARLLDLESVFVRSRELAFDVDLPRDLSALHALIPFLRHRTNARGFTP